MIPPIGGGTRVRLPDGRMATLKLTLEGEPTLAPVPVEPPKVEPPRVVATLTQEAPPPRAIVRQPVLEPAIPANIEALLDHPLIGGRLTICTYCQGNEPALHQRCINSIAATVPLDRIDWRAAVCEGPIETVNLLEGLGVKDTIYETTYRPKAAVMRQLLGYGGRSVATRYVVWFDDDAYVTDPQWLRLLLEMIVVQQPDTGLYGAKFLHELIVNPQRNIDHTRWFRAAPWYRGLPFRTRTGAAAPNGNIVHFVGDGCWAASTEALMRANAPDERLRDTGIAICLGEQLYQHGYKTKLFNDGHKLVAYNPSPQRRLTRKLPWTE